MVIQSDVGGGTDVSNLTYTLDDQAAAGIPNGGPITAGTFQPSSVGDDDFFPQTGADPPPVTSAPAGTCPQAAPAGTATLNATFSGLTLTETGNCMLLTAARWTRVRSMAVGRSPLQRAAAAGTAESPHWISTPITRTDYVVVRNTGGGQGGQITWFVAINGSSPLPAQPWGVSTDFFVPADYDGDGRADYAIWRPGAQGTFFILSSSTFTVRTDSFGTGGDDPTVVGDYNGDGIDDVAVYRPGATAGAASTWFYRTAPNTNFVSLNFGQNGDVACPGDYDGDHKRFRRPA